MGDFQKLHELLSDLKRVAAEHSVIPTRDFYREHGKFDDKAISKFYPTFGEALKAAGLNQAKSKKEVKFFDSIVDRMADFAENFQAPAIKAQGKSVLVIGDTHFPFVAPQRLRQLEALVKQTKPDAVVQMGDLYDFYALSKFPRSRNCYSPFDEVSLGHAMARSLWESIQKASPKSKCYQLLGNHDERPHKRVLESCPDSEVFFSMKSVLTFPGVETVWDIREELELFGRLYFHYRRKIGSNVPYFGKSCVFGHTHREQTMKFDYGKGPLFEYNVGLFGDPHAKEMSYTLSKVTHWTLGGIALIDDFGPRSLVASL